MLWERDWHGGATLINIILNIHICYKTLWEEYFPLRGGVLYHLRQVAEYYVYLGMRDKIFCFLLYPLFVYTFWMLILLQTSKQTGRRVIRKKKTSHLQISLFFPSFYQGYPLIFSRIIPKKGYKCKHKLNLKKSSV